MPKFVKGQSGNPGGRPKGLANAIKQRYGREAFNIVVDIMKGRLKELAYTDDGKQITVAASVKEVREAAKIVLAYTWGTPVSVGNDELERRIEQLEALIAAREAGRTTVWEDGLNGASKN